MTIPKSPEQIKRAGRLALETGVFVAVLCAAFFLGRQSAVADVPVQASVQASPNLTNIESNDINQSDQELQVPDDSSDDSKTAETSAVQTSASFESSSPTVPAVPVGKNFAGSKSGKTYYPIDCAALNRVHPENRVYFAAADDATAAGYHLSAQCGN